MRHTNVLIDEELVKAAKEARINMSETLREALTEKLQMKTTVNIDDVIVDVIDQMSQLDRLRVKLEKRKQDIIDTEKREKKETIEKFKDIPEIQNLSLVQLNDSKLLMRLIELIRDKYNKRVGIVDIKRYYELGDCSGI